MSDKDAYSSGLDSSTINEPNSKANRIAIAASRLAIHFTEEADLPARFRKNSSSKSRKSKDDTEAEKRYKENVETWRHLIETMLGKISHEKAWRYITLSPKANDAEQTLTDNKDFCDFLDYMINRRDKEQCGPDELGYLSMLLSAFQQEVANKIRPVVRDSNS